MTGRPTLDDSRLTTQREVQEAGRYPTEGSLDLLVRCANHRDVAIRAEAFESLGRLDSAEAHQWIVALAANETDDLVRQSLCRAARYWTLEPLEFLIEGWVRGAESSDYLRSEGIAALVEMQAKESLAALESNVRDTQQPEVVARVAGVLRSGSVVRGDRDILSRETNTPLWAWKLWHEDGTVTQLLDDGSVLGPDFRDYNPWTDDWWPSHIQRRGRMGLRRDILALTDGDPSAVRKALSAAIQSPAAASVLHTAIPWLDDPDDLLIPLLETPEPLLRASAWWAAGAFGSARSRAKAVDHLENESVPSVRQMMLMALRGTDSEAAYRALSASL